MSEETNNLDDVLDFLDSTPSIDILKENDIDMGEETELENESVRKEILPDIDILGDPTNEDDPDDEPEVQITEDEPLENPEDTITAVANHFAKLGLLDLEEDEEIEWTEENFISKAKEKWENEAWARLEDLAVERLGEAGTEFIQRVFIEGMPYNTFLESLNQEQSIEDLDPEKNADIIFKAYYKAMGFDEEEISEQIDLAIKNETLVNKANKFKTKLVENTKAERENLAKKNEIQQKARQEREAKTAEIYAETLKAAVKDGDINGVPVASKDMKSLFNFIIDKPHILPNGQKVTDFEYKLAVLKAEDPKKFLTIAKILMDDVNIDLVKKTKETKVVNTLFQELRGSKKPTIKPKKSDYSFLFDK
jgi:hypothetical protein